MIPISICWSLLPVFLTKETAHTYGRHREREREVQSQMEFLFMQNDVEHVVVRVVLDQREKELKKNSKNECQQRHFDLPITRQRNWHRNGKRAHTTYIYTANDCDNSSRAYVNGKIFIINFSSFLLHSIELEPMDFQGLPEKRGRCG